MSKKEIYKVEILAMRRSEEKKDCFIVIMKGKDPLMVRDGKVKWHTSDDDSSTKTVISEYGNNYSISGPLELIEHFMQRIGYTTMPQRSLEENKI